MYQFNINYRGGFTLKLSKKIISLIIACALICCAFAGCSKQNSSEAEEISSKTMFIAYTEENAPFIYTDENGTLTGFDVKLIEQTFESFKGEFENYKFVQVEEGYVLNEDVCYTDNAGNTYSAIIMCGGLCKNTGTVNEDYRWSTNLIENDVITVVKNNSSITDYNSLSGAVCAVVSDTAMTALDKNSAIKNRLASADSYTDAVSAFEALEIGTVNAVIIDSFDFYTYESAANYTVLNGVLDTVEYGFGFSAKNDYSGGFNEAVKEMLSADYGDGDTLTPLVKEHFGYSEACAFTYEEESGK